MKIFHLLLMVCVAFTLTACGSEETSAPTQSSAQPAAKSAPAAVEQAKQVAAQASDKVAQVAQQVEDQAQGAVAQVKELLADGQVVYTKACLSCHKSGLIGAPKVGDRAAWSALIANGEDKMTKNAITGIGRMPAKGGISSLTDAEVAAAVKYMVEQSR